MQTFFSKNDVFQYFCMISRYVEPNDSIFWLYNLFFMGNNITNRLLTYLVYFGLKIDFLIFKKNDFLKLKTEQKIVQS